MTESGDRPGKLAIALIWLGSSLVLVVPLLLILRPGDLLEALNSMLLIWLGPFWILLLERGSGPLVLLLVGMAAAIPAVGGGIWLFRRWRGLSPRVRVFALLAISAAWHLPAIAFFIAVLMSFN